MYGKRHFLALFFLFVFGVSGMILPAQSDNNWYYGKEIQFDENIVNLKCSGKVDLKDNLGDVLEGLTFSFPIKVECENEVYKVSAK